MQERPAGEIVRIPTHSDAFFYHPLEVIRGLTPHEGMSPCKPLGGPDTNLETYEIYETDKRAHSDTKISNADRIPFDETGFCIMSFVDFSDSSVAVALNSGSVVNHRQLNLSPSAFVRARCRSAASGTAETEVCFPSEATHGYLCSLSTLFGGSRSCYQLGGCVTYVSSLRTLPGRPPAFVEGLSSIEK